MDARELERRRSRTHGRQQSRHLKQSLIGRGHDRGAAVVRGRHRVRFDETELDGPPHELDAVAGAELLVERVPVGLDRADGPVEPGRDLGRAQAASEELEHLAPTGRQFDLGPARMRHCWRGVRKACRERLLPSRSAARGCARLREGTFDHRSDVAATQRRGAGSPADCVPRRTSTEMLQGGPEKSPRRIMGVIPITTIQW